MPKFVFRTNQLIGAAAAEQDDYYLQNCFVDIGVLQILQDCEDPRRILVGRTGSGKSALLVQLARVEDHVIPIIPESLSLAYISNSNVLNFFAEAGVDLDLFYRWLWRHVFCVKLLRTKFPEESNKLTGLVGTLLDRLPKNRRYETARRYLNEWGDTFWQETETIIKEATRKVETDLTGSVQGTIPGVATLNGAAARKLTEEQKEEVTNRAREVVSRVQIRELGEVMDMLCDLLQENRQQRFYITIDKLDEDWVEDKIRLRLIKALLQASLDFACVKNAKIIIALRSDLVDRVYRLTRGPGFQEEKFRTSSLELKWSRRDLTEVLDNRIGVLVKHQYVNSAATHADLLPARVGPAKKGRAVSALDYMLDRTLMRPRDIIQFFNDCIAQSAGKPTVTVQALLAAEGIYSRNRFRAMLDEWNGVYPHLDLYAQILKNKPESFLVRELPLPELGEQCLQMAVSDEVTDETDMAIVRKAAEGTIELSQYRKHIVQIFYKVGIAGLKIESGLPISWSFDGGLSVSEAEITEDTRLTIHRTFWRCFGISDR